MRQFVNCNVHVPSKQKRKKKGIYCVAGVTPTSMGAGLCGPRRSSTLPLVCSTSGRCSWAPSRTPTPWAASSTSAVCCTSRITAPVSCLLALLISFCQKHNLARKCWFFSFIFIMQVFLFAGFVWWFFQYLYSRSNISFKYSTSTSLIGVISLRPNT